jgi:hypothetical protein
MEVSEVSAGLIPSCVSNDLSRPNDSHHEFLGYLGVGHAATVHFGDPSPAG